jgi:hypothetical protein
VARDFRDVDYLQAWTHTGFVNFDISDILDAWEFEPGQVMVRKFTGKDGSEKIQLRLDLGILQMSAEGRPDGKRPHDCDSAFDYYLAQRKEHERLHPGNEKPFMLDGPACIELQLEVLQYHHRYLCLFQLEDYEGVIRDTERNVGVFDFVEKHADAEEMVAAVLQFRPQVLMMQTRAKSALALRSNNFTAATTLVESGLEELRAFYKARGREDLLDHSDEIESLQSWLEDINSMRPLSKREKLQRALGEAIRREDYEKAAKYRDALRNLDASQSK